MRIAAQRVEIGHPELDMGRACGNMDSRELILVNSLLRRLCQKYYEFPIIKKHLRKNRIDLTGRVILDAGCGSCYSCVLIASEFHPRELLAFDVMSQQVETARRKRRASKLFVGDAGNIGLRSAAFDAAFMVDVLHHIPAWKNAVMEICRVLRPGGVLLLEETSKETLDGGERYFGLYHPVESRFEWPELVKVIVESGFHVVDRWETYMGHHGSFLCVKR